VPLVPELVRPNWPGDAIRVPACARCARSPINAGMRMRAWYDIRDFDLANRADCRRRGRFDRAGRARCSDREQARGIPPERTFLAGVFARRRHHPRGRPASHADHWRA
jgi:phospholipase/carboxylesterase